MPGSQCYVVLLATAVLISACQSHEEERPTVSRADLMRACMGFDMVVAMRYLRGDTIGIDETGHALVIDEQAYAEADAACDAVGVGGLLHPVDWSADVYGP